MIPIEDSAIHSNLIVIQLPTGIDYVSRKTGAQYLDANSFSWHGELVGEQKGFLSFAKVSGVFHGSLSLTGGVFYSINGKAGNLSIAESVSFKKKSCGVCAFVKSGSPLPPDPRMAAQPAKSWRNGDANLIDLLVIYPGVVTTEVGGSTEVEALIAGAVSDSNLAYSNSLVPLQLRVVHTVEINYTPTGLLDTELSRLQNSNDGYFDEVHDLRDQYGADLVCMLTTDSDAGGLASTMTHPSMSFESSGFNVNVWTQLGAPNYTLAHEIGHNMGCLHNREDSTWDSGYEFSAFSFGKRWIENGLGYGTIMAYDTTDSKYPNTIPFFSNPGVTYLTTATGNIGTEDNAKVLGLSAPYVSNFRDAVIQGIVPSVLSLGLNEKTTGSFKVRLAVNPQEQIDVNVSISGDSNLILSGPTSIQFDENNWNIPQTVMVTAKGDMDTANGTATVSFSSLITSAQIVVSENDTGSHSVDDYLLSGVVRNQLGLGVPGVTLTVSSSGITLVADTNGTFSTDLNDGWSGSVTPVKAGYVFEPSSLNINSMGSDSLGHVFKAVRSNVLYVDIDATGSGDGTSWNDAYTDLSEALVSKDKFTEIWVADGIYLPGDTRPSSFLLPSNIAVYGGFNGTENARSEKDPNINITILSGDIGVQNDNSDNVYHVVIPSSGSILSGFRISDGNANQNYSNDDRGKGGGLWGESSSFSVSDCNFSFNNSYQGGSGMYLKDVNATFINCEFYSNTTESFGVGGAAYLLDSNVSFAGTNFFVNSSHLEGGAIKGENSSIDFNNSEFQNNQSLTSNGGGAIHLTSGTFLFNQCEFSSNFSIHEGGALFAADTNGSIIRSRFIGNQNTTSSGGGALYLTSTSAVISDCNFSSNITHANNFGGAIKLDQSSPSITNCAFVRNQSTINSGGAIYIGANCNPSFINNTFSYNSAAIFGGALFVEDADLSMDTGLFLGNYSKYGGAIGTQGLVSVYINNMKAIGNEANVTADSKAGFIYLNSGTTSSIFVNSIFLGNKSLGRFGVLRPNGLSRFVNCTIVGNQAGTDGGVILLFEGDSIELGNCIVWNNSAATTGNDIWVNSGTASANNSLFDPTQSSGSIMGTSNIALDPFFVDADGADNILGTVDDDVSLQSTSPALDIGSTTFSNYSDMDIIGVSRGASPDAGAYEFSNNFAPYFTTASIFSVPENQTLVADINATDPDGETLVFSISGGIDRAKFLIDSSTGFLSFTTSPDFENPTDSNKDNIYDVQLGVSDGTVSVFQSVSITVLDVLEQGLNEYFVIDGSPSGGGYVLGSGTYEFGVLARLEAVAESGYSFSGWDGYPNVTDSFLEITVDANQSIVANFEVSDPDLSKPDFYGPKTFAQILDSSFSGEWTGGNPAVLESIGNLSHVILADAAGQFCLSMKDSGYTGLESVTVSSLTDGNSTYGRVLRSMFQLQDLNVESLSSNSLTGLYTIRPELSTYSALDANQSTDESTATRMLIRNYKHFGFEDEDTVAYLLFSINEVGETNTFTIQASQRYFFDDSDEGFLEDSSWSSDHWLQLSEGEVSLVASVAQATSFQFLNPSGLINFFNTPGDDFNPASIPWQANSFAPWPLHPDTGEIDVDPLSDNPLMPDGRDYDEVDENYQLQFGAGSSATAIASVYLDYIESALSAVGVSLRYDKSLYLSVRENMISHTVGALDEYNSELDYPTVPIVYFTNAQDSNGSYHPFMVIGSINGTGGPNFLTDVPRPPGDGSSGEYAEQSITRNAILSTVLAKIPLKDYGLASTLLDNNLSDVGSLLVDSGTGEVPSVYNYASNSVSGIAVDGVKIYPSLNNTLSFAQTNAEISSTGVHVGQGMGLHYHADGHSFNGSGINLYNSEDYVGKQHPPLIGFSLDGLALYGKYEIEYPSMHGFGSPLDQFGSHSHDGYGPHYHAHTTEVTDTWQGEDYNFTKHFFLVGAYRGLINDIPGFQNINTNQLKDDTLKKYVGAIDTYTGPDFNEIQCTVDLTAAENGTVSGGGIFDIGAQVNLNAVANTGYFFVDWVGDLNSSENPLTITIDSNLSLTANFSLIVIEPDPFEFNATVLSVAEDAPVGSEVGYVYRTSGDLNRSVVYTLENDGFTSSFSVESNGSILVASELDYESNTSLPITILGTEGNRTLVKEFTVSIIDVNETEPPVEEPDPFEFNATVLSVAEDAPVGTVIGYIYPVSENDDEPVVFSLEQNETNYPILVQSTGTVVVYSTLDFERNASYLISVRGTQGEQSMVRSFPVEVLDIDESQPIDPGIPSFAFDATALSIKENSVVGTSPGHVFRTSGNLDLNVSYYFEGQLGNGFPFVLDENGSIFLSGYLDYENKSSYLVHIRGQEGERAVLRQFVISVEDVFEMGLNQAPTDIISNPKVLRVKGNTDPINLVGEFSAVDSDLLDQHQFRFIDKDIELDHGYFTLDPNGSLQTNSTLNFGQDQNLSILIQVTDPSGASYQKEFIVFYDHQEPGEDVVLLSAGADIISGWKRAGWFGYYFSRFYPWIHHENLGWVYVIEKDYEGVWFYRNRLGWTWTSSNVFPSLYQFKTERWTFLERNSRTTLLFDYDRVEWFELDRDFEVSGLSIPSDGGYVTGYGVYQRGEAIKLEAFPVQGYLFDRWQGDLSGENTALEVEVFSDLKVKAKFKPIVSDDAPPLEAVRNAFEAVNLIGDLSPELRQKATVELLLTGESNTAGIPKAE